MRFLYATDGSEGAMAGAAFLSRLPLTEVDEITLLTVVQHEESRLDAKPVLDAAQAALAGTQAVVRQDTRHGNAALEIIDAIRWAAEEVSTDCIVMGTRGLNAIARFFLGSVAERAARMAPVPVLVARASEATQPVSRVVIGYDGSKGARHAVSFVDRMPLPPNAEICLATLAASRTAGGFLPGPLANQVEQMRQEEKRQLEQRLNEAAAALRATGRNVVTELRDSDADPASGLIELAEERGADLLAVGALGLSEVERFLIGSVADKVLRHASCSVLIVRPLPGME